jgi:hypothetical protein
MHWNPVLLPRKTVTIEIPEPVSVRVAVSRRRDVEIHVGAEVPEVGGWVGHSSSGSLSGSLSGSPTGSPVAPADLNAALSAAHVGTRRLSQGASSRSSLSRPSQGYGGESTTTRVPHGSQQQHQQQHQQQQHDSPAAGSTTSTVRRFAGTPGTVTYDDSVTAGSPESSSAAGDAHNTPTGQSVRLLRGGSSSVHHGHGGADSASDCTTGTTRRVSRRDRDLHGSGGGGEIVARLVRREWTVAHTEIDEEEVRVPTYRMVPKTVEVVTEEVVSRRVKLPFAEVVQSEVELEVTRVEDVEVTVPHYEIVDVEAEVDTMELEEVEEVHEHTVMEESEVTLHNSRIVSRDIELEDTVIRSEIHQFPSYDLKTYRWAGPDDPEGHIEVNGPF